MTRSQEVPVKYRRKRGLCEDCGGPQNDRPHLFWGGLCRNIDEHPGLCCACFDKRVSP